MWQQTSLTRAWGLRLPIVGAPMAGGPGTPALTAAVSAAGGLGILAGGYRTPEELGGDLASLRAATGEPFGVNLLLPDPAGRPPGARERAQEIFRPYAEELGLPWPPPPAPPPSDLDAHLEVVLAANPTWVTFTFGVPDREQARRLQRHGIAVGATATTAQEARMLADAGVDLLVLQGSEAGGHRGSFAGGADDGMVGLLPLLRSVVPWCPVPVLAAGGVSDGAGVAACLVAGAAGVALGTAFLLCPESGTSGPYRRALAAARDGRTVITRAISGKPARGLPNRLTAELAATDIPPYEVTNAVTRPLRQRAAALDDARFLSLWAGQGVAALRRLPAADLVAVLQNETEQAFSFVPPPS